MDNVLNNHLVELHHKVAALKVYDAEAGNNLNKYAHEFGKTMSELLSLDAEKFNDINLNYLENTYKSCTAAAKGKSEDERSEAFYNGVGSLNININDCLEYFSQRV
jgi:hypothetical protein